VLFSIATFISLTDEWGRGVFEVERSSSDYFLASSSFLLVVHDQNYRNDWIALLGQFSSTAAAQQHIDL